VYSSAEQSIRFPDVTFAFTCSLFMDFLSLPRGCRTVGISGKAVRDTYYADRLHRPRNRLEKREP
jgi:hypothetical protein